MTLSERSQTQNDKYSESTYMKHQNRKFIETKSRLELIKGWVKGSMRNYWLMGFKFIFGVI